MKLIRKKEFFSIAIIIAINLAIGFYINLYPMPKWVPLASLLSYKHEFLCVIITFIVLICSLYVINDYITKKNILLFNYLKKFYDFVENKSLLLLLIFICLIIAWFGFVIFRNPFLYDYNSADGSYYVQLLHNVSQGVGPEQTRHMKANFYLQNNSYYFASIFSVGHYWLPILLLAPFYWLYPYPPMHVFSIVAVVIFLGSFGAYLAIRAMGGSKFLSLLGAIGYCVIPWMEIPILWLGYFDNLGFAIYPYVFAFLFSRKWILLYVSVFFLSAISFTYTYSTIGLSIVMAVFYRSWRQSVVVFLIGLIMMNWDMAIFRQSIEGIWNNTMSPPGFFTQFVLNFDVKLLSASLIYYAFYIISILMTLSFLPLLGIRNKNAWNWPIIGMLCFALSGALMNLFRSYGLEHHRNSNLVVPLYICAFMTYVNIRNNEMSDYVESKLTHTRLLILSFLLFSSITSMSLWYTWHYPWAGMRNIINQSSLSNLSGVGQVYLVKLSPDNYKFSSVLSKINQYVPQEAAVAYMVDGGLEAYLTNRQKVWPIGFHPEGVEYYIVQTSPIQFIFYPFYPEWQKCVVNLKNNVDRYKLIYHDDMLDIYKNVYPVAIPRLEDNLEWNIILKPFRTH